MLEAFAPDLWTCSAPLSLAGVPFGTRMTVVRTDDGGLVLISPVEIDDALADALGKLGEVRALVAPNRFHHFYFAAASQRYPSAERFLVEGVAEKMEAPPDGAQRLADDVPPAWEGALEQVALEGAPLTNEVVFFHPTSRTLILTDLCFNFDPAPSGWPGLFLWLAGARGRLAVSRLMRSGFKDRTRVRASVERILAWDFDALIVTHGNLIESGAKARFSAATGDL